MKYYILISLCFLIATGQAQSKVTIEPNKNIEFLGLVYTLYYENPKSILYDTHDPNWQYGQELIERWQQDLLEEDLIEMLSKVDHLWISDLYPLLLKVKDFPSAQLPQDLEDSNYVTFSTTHDVVQGRANASLFLQVMNKLYVKLAFDQYWKESRPYYEAAVKELQQSFQLNYLSEAENYYQYQYDRYIISPSLTIPPSMGFATQHHEKAYILFSAQSFQDLDTYFMGFKNTATKDIMLHELGHTLLKPALGQLSDSLLQFSSVAHEAVEQDMKKQNYLHWKGIMDEYLTRTGEVLINRIVGDSLYSHKLYQYHYEEKNFIYLPLFTAIQWEFHQEGNSYRASVNEVVRELATGYSKYVDQKLPDPEKVVVRGKVMNKSNGQPIPFVNIGVRKRNIGTISKEDGSFELALEGMLLTDSLSFSMVGFQPVSYSVKELPEDFIKVALEEDVRILKEVVAYGKEERETVKLGRWKTSKTTRGQSNTNSYGTGAAYGIKIKPENKAIMLEKVNFHMRFNTTDSILFRINILSIKEGEPARSILGEPLYMKSYRGEKWISQDFGRHRIVIAEEVLISYEVIKVWFSGKTKNNIFFTFGKGYDQGGAYIRKASFANWESGGDAFPIAMYITGRAL